MRSAEFYMSKANRDGNTSLSGARKKMIRLCRWFPCCAPAKTRSTAKASAIPANSPVVFRCGQKISSVMRASSSVRLTPITSRRCSRSRALERRKARRTQIPSWYLDLELLESYYWGHKYHHTASATMFYALREGLAMVIEESRENRWERHQR